MKIKSNIRWTCLLALDYQMGKVRSQKKKDEIDLAMRFFEESGGDGIREVMAPHPDHPENIIPYEIDDLVLTTYVSALRLWQKNCDKYWQEQCSEAIKLISSKIKVPG